MQSQSNIHALAMTILNPYWPYYMALSVLLLVFITKLLIQRFIFVKSLDCVPGPPGLPILGNALSLTGEQDEFFRFILDLHKIHGPIIKLWVGMRPFVFISKAEYVQPLLNSSLHMDKSFEYSFLQPWLGNGLLITTGSKWHSKRKLLTPAFHYNILEQFLEPMYDNVQVLVDKIQVHAGQGYFNILPHTKLCALDVICDTAMGKHLKAQENQNSGYVKAVDGMGEILQRRFITPWLKPDFIFSKTSWGKRQAKYLKTIHEFAEAVIKDRKKLLKEKKMENGFRDNENVGPRKKRLAFLDLLLQASEDGQVLTDEDIRDEVNTFMFAGHDTTSISVAWCLYVLGQHKEAQSKILEEYDRKLGPDTVIPTYKEMQQLEYLERCVRETIRLYPVAPLIARDLKEPLDIGDMVLPPGVTVLINSYALHRNVETFTEPDKFNPDRFLSENNDTRHPFAFIPFSAGLRNCIGSKFAMMEVKITILYLLKHYHVYSDPDEELHLLPEIVLNNRNGIKIRIEKR